MEQRWGPDVSVGPGSPPFEKPYVFTRSRELADRSRHGNATASSVLMSSPRCSSRSGRRGPLRHVVIAHARRLRAFGRTPARGGVENHRRAGRGVVRLLFKSFPLLPRAPCWMTVPSGTASVGQLRLHSMPPKRARRGSLRPGPRDAEFPGVHRPRPSSAGRGA